MADIAAPSAAPALPLTSRQRNAAGALCLLLIIVSWLTQAELMHRLHLTEQSYAPAQMIFVIHAVWALGLPLALLVRWLALRPTLPPIPWRAAALYGLVVSQIGFFGLRGVLRGPSPFLMLPPTAAAGAGCTLSASRPWA